MLNLYFFLEFKGPPEKDTQPFYSPLEQMEDRSHHTSYSSLPDYIPSGVLVTL